ncbi:hypothetical protein ANOM_007774 [Aspergillus nomiae NRRL 13137]|uniref:Zn(2)-C6 fungal-type domain-containing protein n=1 Tax=Aspergillus nomiae NRRL (strain ATCC 15546 / NRRL 13137 / CBS 260.88 / M93) TaxID=1509407 RepID=A0A0L1IWY6_ASPN3|nr:uncharacterized protein ANOM_007774 [Aspergillus nomiae NRRL 13137]KNG83997.1 hypothetical protein ANOM_007774 [Aspergillus nomiae NRRL 13137]
MDDSGPRGHRQRKACDLCHQKKIRCDRQKPACETCYLAGERCIFSSWQPLTRQTIQGQLADAKARIRALEASIAFRPSWTGDCAGRSYFQSPFDLNVAIDAFQWHIQYCWPGVANSLPRDAFHSAVYSQTGAMFDLQRFLQEATQTFMSLNPFYTVPQKQNVIPQWPKVALVQRCIDYFIIKGLYSIFSVVDPEALQTLIAKRTLEYTEASSRASDWACLTAFTALIARLHPHEFANVYTDSDAYIQAVLMLLPDLLMETANMRTLEALLLLTLYFLSSGQSQKAERFLSIAVRIVYNLGGNRVTPPRETEADPKKHNHLRALFWHCYAIDKDMSLRKREPPLMHDIDCDLDLPPNYVPSSNEQFFKKPLSPDKLIFPSDLRLTLIKARIYHYLYSNHGRAQPEATQLRHIRELDQEMSDLKANFPADCRPDAFAMETAPDALFHDLSTRGVTLHLEYYFCLGRVHEASSICGMSFSHSWSAVPSSVELYHEAARSTLLYIRRVPHIFTWHTFWIHAQVLLTAVLNLFWYLIQYPTARSFGADLEILEHIRQMFIGLIRTADSERPFPPFYITEAFIGTLIGLAKRSLARTTEN